MSARGLAAIAAALAGAAAIPSWAASSSCGAGDPHRARCVQRAARRHPHPARSLPPAALGVREHEFRIALSRPSVPGGRVIVELDNEGQDGHDLRLAREGSDRPLLSFDELRAGGRATKTVALAPGTYRLWCSLPGHDAAGMHALLRVP